MLEISPVDSTMYNRIKAAYASASIEKSRLNSDRPFSMNIPKRYAVACCDLKADTNDICFITAYDEASALYVFASLKNINLASRSSNIDVSTAQIQAEFKKQGLIVSTPTVDNTKA